MTRPAIRVVLKDRLATIKPPLVLAVSLFSASGSDRDHCSLAPGQMLSSGLTDFAGIHGRELLRQGRLLRTVTKFIHAPRQTEVHFQHSERHVRRQLGLPRPR